MKEITILSMYLTVLSHEVYHSTTPSGLSVMLTRSDAGAALLIFEPNPSINRGESPIDAMPKIVEWVGENKEKLEINEGVEPHVFIYDLGRIYLAQPAWSVEQRCLKFSPNWIKRMSESEVHDEMAKIGVDWIEIKKDTQEIEENINLFVNSKTARANSVLRTISNQWPDVFKNHLPLKLGVYKDLMRELPHIKASDIQSAMSAHCSTKRYQKNIVEGKPRYGLDGEVSGYIETVGIKDDGNGVEEEGN